MSKPLTKAKIHQLDSVIGKLESWQNSKGVHDRLDVYEQSKINQLKHELIQLLSRLETARIRG